MHLSDYMSRVGRYPRVDATYGNQPLVEDTYEEIPANSAPGQHYTPALVCKQQVIMVLCRLYCEMVGHGLVVHVNSCMTKRKTMMRWRSGCRRIR